MKRKEFYALAEDAKQAPELRSILIARIDANHIDKAYS